MKCDHVITHHTAAAADDDDDVGVLYRGVEVSDCGRYVVCSICHGCDPVNRLYFCDLNTLTEGITGHYLICLSLYCMHFLSPAGLQLAEIILCIQFMS